MHLLVILALGAIMPEAPVGALAPPIDPPSVTRHWTADERILFAMRRMLLSPTLKDVAPEDRDGLWTFYAGRGDGPLWVTSAGWSPKALAVIKEIGEAGDWGLDPAAFKIPKLTLSAAEGSHVTEKDMAAAEMGLSLAVLKYARYARGGRIPDPATQLSSYLDRKPPVRLPWRVMAEIAKSDTPEAYLRGLNPQHEQFELLRQSYLARRGAGTRAIEIPVSGPNILPGKIHADIALIRERLRVPAPAGQEAFYDPALAEAVKAFQKRKDISPANGTIDRQTRRALTKRQDVPLKTILANMEEWRWMPEDLGETYVWVNVPEFKLRVVRNGQVVYSDRVVTGQEDKQTPVFSEDLKTIFFNPRWYIPESIKMKEIKPNLSGGYFARRGYRVVRNGHAVDPATVNWSKADIREYDIYQPPGDGNALGVLKFTFPNKHAVYMHDTPSKGLFDAAQRTFSHGCVRLQHPLQLAQLLLSFDKGWSATQVTDMIKEDPKDSENGVAIDGRIPVHITYFTAQAEPDGEITTEADIYGHEKRISLALDGKWDQIDRTTERVAELEPDDRPAQRSSGRRYYDSGASTGSRGGGWSAPTVSRGTSANDIFRQNFGN
jgi:murein L,D-transpeptidase YcbB/YkuD